MRVEAGVICRVIGGTDSLNIGKTVKVASFQGEHSKLGRIWRCTAQDCSPITEYGVVGIAADFAQSWLEPLPPVAAKTIDLKAVA